MISASSLVIERPNSAGAAPEEVLVTPGWRQIGKVAGILSHFDAPSSSRSGCSAPDLESQLITSSIGIDVY